MTSGMSTADWAIIISLCSLAVSAAGFIWNIWSKFIYPKPKVRVSFSIMAMHPPPPGNPSLMSLGATNHGPGEVTLHVTMARFRRWPFSKYQHEILAPSTSIKSLGRSDGPFSGGLPRKLGVGDSFSVYFPFPAPFLKKRVTDVGFVDTFGKHHWAPRSKLKAVREKHLKEISAKAGENNE